MQNEQKMIKTKTFINQLVGCIKQSTKQFGSLIASYRPVNGQRQIGLSRHQPVS